MKADEEVNREVVRKTYERLWSMKAGAA